MNHLNQLLIEELQDLYHAEKQLIKALPKMAAAAQNAELAEAFKEHLQETRTHLERIEGAFKALGESPKAKTCKAMQGLIAEGEEIISEHKGSPCVDAALISAAQKVEHYEIASYGCVRTWAKLLGEDEARQLIEETLEEEKAADDKLTQIARALSNEKAMDSDEEEPSPRTSRKSCNPRGSQRLGRHSRNM